MRRRPSQQLLLMFAVMTAAGSLACAGSEAAERDARRDLAELSITRGDLVTRMLLTGELVAEDAEPLTVPNANIWPVQIRWLAEDGIEVKKGDRVVEFDNSQLTSNLEQLRGQATEAANQLDSLKAQAAAEEASAVFELEQRRATVAKARLEAEVPASLLAERDYQERQLARQKAELELETAETKLAATHRGKASEIEVQRIKLTRAIADVARSEQRLELLTLSASRDGILILGNYRREKRSVQVGDGVFPGRVVGRLPDLATMMVSARLFDVDDGRIAAGDRVVATLDAFPEASFSGRIREIDQIAEQANSRSLRRFFNTRIDLDHIDTERMRPGMSVKVLIEQRHDDVLLVPRQRLDWTPQGPRALTDSGTWTEVTLGPCDAVACVLESGLETLTAEGPEE